MESGFRSSTFWMSLVVLIAPILVLSGLVPESDKNMVLELMKQGVSGIVAIVTLVSYIMSRTELHKTEIESKNKTLG